MWEAFWAIAYKEVLHLARDTNKIRRMFFVQLLTFAMLATIDLAIKNVPTVVVDQDRTAESRELAARLTATHTFDIRYTTTSTEQARGHIRAGRARVAVVIPPDYSRMRTAGEEAQILALVDGADSAASSQAIGALEGVTSRMNVEARQEVIASETSTAIPHVDLLFNPLRLVSSFMLPGGLAMILGLAYARFVAISITRERDSGNLERLLMTPIDYRGLILGKVAPWFLIAVLNGLLYLLAIRFGFGVPIRGSIVLLLGCLLLYILTVLSAGAFIGAGSRGTGEAMGVIGFLSLPSMFLSGYLFPLSSLPKALLLISYGQPQTHFIEIMRGICLRGASARELAPHLAYLVIAPIFFTLGAARRFSRTIMK